jgi:hypothetical protein
MPISLEQLKVIHVQVANQRSHRPPDSTFSRRVLAGSFFDQAPTERARHRDWAAGVPLGRRIRCTSNVLRAMCTSTSKGHDDVGFKIEQAFDCSIQNVKPKSCNHDDDCNEQHDMSLFPGPIQQLKHESPTVGIPRALSLSPVHNCRSRRTHFQC